MKTTSIQLLALLATALTASAKEPRPPKGHRPPPPPPSALFEAIDTDHDGTLSAEEIKNSAASIAKLDKDGDGEVTREELHIPPPPKDAEGGQEPPDGPPDGKPPGPPPEGGEAPQ